MSEPKPHIKRRYVLKWREWGWECRGLGYLGIGGNPHAAYREWREWRRYHTSRKAIQLSEPSM